MSRTPNNNRVGTLGAAGAVAIVAAIVGQFEGRKLLAYIDPVGIPTICEGWTRGVALGDVATDAECDVKTLTAIREADDVFARNVPADVRARLKPETHAAFLSFIYNVGPGARGVKDGFVVLKSGRQSTMLTRLRQGDVVGACSQLPKWTKAGGRELRGLVTRRAAEYKLCITGLL